MSSAGRGHNEGTAGFTLVPWLPCTVWGRAAGRTSAWAPCNTSQPSYTAQPRPCSTSHLNAAAPGRLCGPPHPSQQRCWALLAASPAVPITCCCWGRALGPAPAARLPLTQCQLLAAHSSPCTPGPRASSSGQAWRAGRRRQLSQAFKGDRASFFPCQAGAEPSSLAGHKVLPGAIPVHPADPRDGLDLSSVTTSC